MLAYEIEDDLLVKVSWEKFWQALPREDRMFFALHTLGIRPNHCPGRRLLHELLWEIFGLEKRHRRVSAVSAVRSRVKRLWKLYNKGVIQLHHIRRISPIVKIPDTEITGGEDGTEKELPVREADGQESA